jgi:histone demethylase JARID1
LVSILRSKAFDLTTVERRARKDTPKGNRLFGLQDAPTYRPTKAEFKDPARYIASIEQMARDYGIAKIVLPDDWEPTFAIDTEVSADLSTDYQRCYRTSK